MSFASATPRLRSGLFRFSHRLFRRRRVAGAALLLALSSAALIPSRAHAQNPGTQDTVYAPAVSNATVFTLGLQVDIFNTERVVFGGDNRILQRTFENGTNDTSFTQIDSFGDSNRTVYTLAFETVFPGTDVGTINSRIYVGGLFGQSTNPTTGLLIDAVQNITRINSNGTLDATFNPGGLGANKEVTAILPVPASLGGGLFVGGLFERYNGVDHNHLIKLLSDGTVDSAFNSNLQTGDTVFALAAQIDPATGLPNGQVLAAGSFNSINNSQPAKLARLNADGSLDTTFNPEFTTRVLTVAVQPDGKIMAGGDFDEANGVRANNIVRLNQDGTTDPTFAAEVTGNINPANTPPTAVNMIKLVQDGTGRMLVGGNFLKVNKTDRIDLARLAADGTLDTGFDSGTLLKNRVQAVVVQKDNKVVIGETRINRTTDTGPYPNVVVRVFGGSVPQPVASLATVVKKARAGFDLADDGRKPGRFEILRSLPIADDLKVTITSTKGHGRARNKDYNLFLYDEATDKTLGEIMPDLSSRGRVTRYFVTIPAYTDHVFVQVVPNPAAQGSPTRRAEFVLNDESTYGVAAPDTAVIKILPPLPFP